MKMAHTRTNLGILSVSSVFSVSLSSGSLLKSKGFLNAEAQSKKERRRN